MTSTFVWPFGMWLAGRIGSRPVIAIGGFITVTMTYFSTLVSSVAAFFILYGLGFGVGKGFLYPAPLKAGWSHLPGRKGFVSGFVVSGLGIGAFIFGLVAKNIVNPDNLTPSAVTVAVGYEEHYFPTEVNERVPRMISTLCLVWSIMLVVGIILITNYDGKPLASNQEGLLQLDELILIRSDSTTAE
jgi:hypothetical protein